MKEEVYPKAPIAKVEDVIEDEQAMADEMVQLMRDGAKANYFRNGDKDIGKFLDSCHITGIVQHGKNSPEATRRLWDRVQAEMKAYRAVSIADCATETAYKTELGKVKTFLDEADWVAGMKAEAGVTKWSDLKSIVDAKVVEKI